MPIMKTKLFLQAVSKFIMGLLMIGALLFLPAGTFCYWNAWLFIVLLFLPMFILGAVLWMKAPDLLAKRLNSKEKETEQKHVVAVGHVVCHHCVRNSVSFICPLCGSNAGKWSYVLNMLGKYPEEPMPNYY